MTRFTIKFYKISKQNEVIFITYRYCKRGSDSNTFFSIKSILLQDKSLEKGKIVSQLALRYRISRNKC